MRDSTGSSSCAPDGEPFALQRESVGLACLAQRGRPFDDAPIKVDMATAAGVASGSGSSWPSAVTGAGGRTPAAADA